MFTASELSDFRATQRANMPDTFRLEVPGAFTPDEGGGGEYAAPTIVEYPCRLAPLGEGPEERTVAEQLQVAGLQVLVLLLEAVVTLKSEGTWIHHETGESRRFAVRAMPPRTYRTARRVIVAPLQG